MNLKDHLASLLSQGLLGEAIHIALSQFKEDELDFEKEQVIQFSARWNILQKEMNMGPVSFEERMAYEDNLRSDFMRFLSLLPDDLDMLTPPEPESKISGKSSDKSVGISEDRFKWHVFVGLTFIKGGLLLYLTYLNSVGMPTEDYKTLFGLMLPVFTTAFVLMAKHLFERRRNLILNQGYRVNRRTQLFTYLVLIVYLISVVLALRSYGRSSGNLSTLIDWINAIEAILGGALGYIVSTLFKSEK